MSTSSELAQILDGLAESRDEFFTAIDLVSPTQWNWKPEPERWSIGETVEHIVLAEGVLFRFVQTAVAASPNPAWAEQTRGKTELLLRVMPSRQGKAVAPDPIVPREGIALAQARQRFEPQRTGIVSFVRDTRVALQEHTAVHPFPVFGTLNAYQWLLLVALHTRRHNQQIVEVKATPGYPAR